MILLLLLLLLEGVHHLDLVVQTCLLERWAHGAALLEVEVHTRPEDHGMHVQRLPCEGCWGGGVVVVVGGDHVGDGLPVVVGVV